MRRVTVRHVRVEVAGVLVGLDDELRAAPEPRDATRPAGQIGRQDRPDEARWVAAGQGQQVQDPARRRGLAVRAGHGDQSPPAGRHRVGDDLLDALRLDADRARRDELGMVGLDGRDRLGDRQPVDHGHAVRADDVRRIVPPIDRDARGHDRRVDRIRPTGIAARDDRAGRVGVEGRTGRRRAADPQDVDARPGRDRTAGSGRGQTRRDLLGRPRHPRSPADAASTRSRSRSRAAWTLAAMFSPRSPVHTNRRTSSPSASWTAT